MFNGGFTVKVDGELTITITLIEIEDVRQEEGDFERFYRYFGRR